MGRKIRLTLFITEEEVPEKINWNSQRKKAAERIVSRKMPSC